MLTFFNTTPFQFLEVAADEGGKEKQGGGTAFVSGMSNLYLFCIGLHSLYHGLRACSAALPFSKDAGLHVSGISGLESNQIAKFKM